NPGDMFGDIRVLAKVATEFTFVIRQIREGFTKLVEVCLRCWVLQVQGYGGAGVLRFLTRQNLKGESRKVRLQRLFQARPVDRKPKVTFDGDGVNGTRLRDVQSALQTAPIAAQLASFAF